MKWDQVDLPHRNNYSKRLSLIRVKEQGNNDSKELCTRKSYEIVIALLDLNVK